MKKNRSKSNPHISHYNDYFLKSNNLSSVIPPNRINSVNFLKFQPRIKITKKNLYNLSSSIIDDDNNHINYDFRFYNNCNTLDKKNNSRNRMNKTSLNLNRLLLNIKKEIVGISQNITNEKNINSNFKEKYKNSSKPKLHYKRNNNKINKSMNYNNNNIRQKFISLKKESAFKNSYIPFNKRINKSYIFNNSKELSINDLKDEKINTLINENDLFERKLKKSNGLLPELIKKGLKYEIMNNALKKENLKKSDINIKENENYSNSHNENRIEYLANDINEILGNDEEIKKSINNILKNNSSYNKIQNDIKKTNQEYFETFKYQNTENGASNKLNIFEISKSDFNIISEKGVSYHKEILYSQCEIIELRNKLKDINEQYKNEQLNNNKMLNFNHENYNKNEQIEELNKQIRELKKEIEELKKENYDLLKENEKYINFNKVINIRNEEFKQKELQLENKNNKINIKKNDYNNYKIIKNGNLKFLNSKNKNEEIINKYENILKIKDEEIKNLKENIQSLINDLKGKNELENEYIKELDENDIETMKMTMENLRELVAEKEKEIKYLKSLTESQNSSSKHSNHNSQNKFKLYKIELENCKLQYQEEIEQNNLLKEEIKNLKKNKN